MLMATACVSDIKLDMYEIRLPSSRRVIKKGLQDALEIFLP